MLLMHIGKVRRILIVKLSAIGDVVCGLPILCALRQRFPHAHISWLVEKAGGKLLAGHRALDELIVLPRGWLKYARLVWSLHTGLRRSRVDVVIDVQGLARSAIAGLISSARVRIGFASPEAREGSAWTYTHAVAPTAAHVVDRNLELLTPLGIHAAPAQFELPESATDKAWAVRLIRERRLEGGFAIINPGAGWGSKRWEMPRFAEVAYSLGATFRLPSLVIWAGVEEKAWAEQIAAASGGYASPAPPTSLTELASLCRRATLFLSSDTGPLHIAAAVGLPCVGLFGASSGSRNGPYGDKHIVLQKVELTGPSRMRRGADNEALRKITSEEVVAACGCLLNRRLAA
jgi:lipopolysaccharide heptosyltransferase I